MWRKNNLDKKKRSRKVFVVAVVFVILLATSSVAAINPVQSASAAAFPGTNGKIAFVLNQDIYVINADGSDKTRLTNNNSTYIVSSPSWSPDGTKIAFESTKVFLEGGRQGENSIYVMSGDGSGAKKLADLGPSLGFTGSPNWSPDGTKIVFVDGNNTTSKIYTMNATDGSGRILLTLDNANDYGPIWSPDGTKIAFTSVESNNRAVYVMNADGSGRIRLTNNSSNNGAADWSPDGTKIIFATDRDDPEEPNFLPRGNSIYTMNADGSGQQSLYAGSVADSFDGMHFSPDGTKIVFSVEGFEEGPNIYTMNADGSGQPTLLKGGEGGHAPNWGVQPHSQSTQNSTLAINAVSQNDGQVLHVYAKILSSNGTVLKKGFTPMNFTGTAGTSYTVSVANYLARDFDHWDNNSTDRTRTIDLSANNAAVTAFYDTSSSKSGYTRLTYDDTAAGKPSLTVNATSIGGSGNDLHMWTIIKLQSINGASGNNKAMYTVAASNYGDKVFDHWEDGSTHRLRTLSIIANTTITAYYRTG